MTAPRLTVADVEEILGGPFEETRHQCHGVSLAIVCSGRLPGSRVARGTCDMVGSQHSWVVVGDDCYAKNARIVDAVLWSWHGTEPAVFNGTPRTHGHRPHSFGSIWDWGRPPAPTGPIVELAVDPGRDARLFLEMAAPDGLDRRGWDILAKAPVEGWPAGAILGAMDDTPALSSLVPIDVLGMVTDRNPGGLYLPPKERA